jgi:type IV pilus assembly protein PilA
MKPAKRIYGLVRAFTLVEIMIVVAIIALLAAIAIPNLITARRTANEAAAKANLRTLSTAAETFYISRQHYPDLLSEFEEFVNSASNYCADLAGTLKAVQGYNYSCVSDTTGYTFEAQPVTPGTTGNITYTATTGGVLTPQ